jgi:hypothetical protein
MRLSPGPAASRWLLATGRCLLALALGIAAAAGLTGVWIPAQGVERAQLDFATAEEAADTLIAAVRADDQRQLLRILGPAGHKLIHSGDRVADRDGRQRLLSAYDSAHRIETDGASAATLILGAEEWSLPIPLVRQGARWRFDTDASAQKIIDRRVGRNELSVIEVCRAYWTAQRQYAAHNPLTGGPGPYATRFASSPGRRDGLYWEAAPGEEQSPLGPLVAQAHAEGYAGGEHQMEHQSARQGHQEPYHGYYFRILTGQGPHAPGGARDYLVAGQMTGGFALLAYPAKWGDSGIMSFEINQSGIVFAKNLGPDTAKRAREITQYDPDLSWHTR